MSKLLLKSIRDFEPTSGGHAIGTILLAPWDDIRVLDEIVHDAVYYTITAIRRSWRVSGGACFTEVHLTPSGQVVPSKHDGAREEVASDADVGRNQSAI